MPDIEPGLGAAEQPFGEKLEPQRQRFRDGNQGRETHETGEAAAPPGPDPDEQARKRYRGDEFDEQVGDVQRHGFAGR